MRIESKIIGLAAPSCAGKTTVSEIVKQILGDELLILHYDSYDLFPSDSSVMVSVRNGTRIVTNWEDPVLFDHEAYTRDLERLRNGENVILYDRSREGMKRSGSKAKAVLVPKPFILVEGVFPYIGNRERSMFDVLTFLDIPLRQMIIRRMSRRGPEPYEPWDDSRYIGTLGQSPFIDGTIENVIKPQIRYAYYIFDAVNSPEATAQTIVSLFRS